MERFLQNSCYTALPDEEHHWSEEGDTVFCKYCYETYVVDPHKIYDKKRIIHAIQKKPLPTTCWICKRTLFIKQTPQACWSCYSIYKRHRASLNSGAEHLLLEPPTKIARLE